MANYPGYTLRIMHGNPDGFGKYYTGSVKCRHRQIKRKQLAKRK